ncbi:MAG: hypothetical protein AAF485_12695 [Chloroflexota bacterium]
MNRKTLGIIIGAIIGAVVLGICSSLIGDTWRIIGIVVGLIIGGVGGMMFVVGQAQMSKDRETGLDG